MDNIPGVLADEIAEIFGGDESVDLLAALGALRRNLRQTLPAYAGLEMTFLSGVRPVRVTLMEPVADVEIVSSLKLPVAAADPALTNGTLVAFSTVSKPSSGPGIGRPIGVVNAQATARQEEPAPHRKRSAVTGLQESRNINQAMGMLIAGGRNSDEALAELQRLADQAATSMADQATLMISK